MRARLAGTHTRIHTETHARRHARNGCLAVAVEKCGLSAAHTLHMGMYSRPGCAVAPVPTYKVPVWFTLTT